jgi:hypothetical protein
MEDVEDAEDVVEDEDEDEDEVDDKSLLINEWYCFGKFFGSCALESDKFTPNTIYVL